jgi:hypothetical protein
MIFYVEVLRHSKSPPSCKHARARTHTHTYSARTYTQKHSQHKSQAALAAGDTAADVVQFGNDVENNN